jgi:phosphomannomutase/phosphoglucomutase
MDLFGSSGTRGVANRELTPEFAVEVGRAAATVWAADRVALARDTRATGTMFANAVASGLASAGADVDRLGVLPTPGLQAYADREGVPGAVVTASHNPPQYNGIKLFEDDGTDLSVDRIEAVEATLRDESFSTPAWTETGAERRVDGARRAYREEIVAAVDRDRIAGADLTVAIDPGHGAGALTSPDLFRELGCRVRTINAQPDGTFPGRDPEPVEENLGDLARFVRATDADVGIAHDGDADRAIFVDETGAFVDGGAAFAALAAADLSPGDAVVSAVTATQRLVDVTHDVGADLELTPVGSVYITDRVRELQAAGRTVPIAGEGNGGVIFPGYRLARDGAYAAARFLELLADRRASEVVAAYDDYHTVRANMAYDSDVERERMLDAIAEYANADAEVEVTTIDGYRLDYGDGWVLARESGTEPLVRIYAEATDQERATALLDGMRRAVEV